MLRVFAGLFVAAFLTIAVFGQSTGKLPVFDIADVHVSAHSTNPNMTGGVFRAGRFELRRATMVDLIRTAYSVESDSVVGGPSWLEWDRFDVIAKVSQDTPPATVWLMLQSLLADRFKLVVHNETRPMPALVLTVGKGKPKLKESEGSGNGCEFQRPKQPQSGPPPYIMFSCRHITMDAFARQLRQMARDYISIPVVDSTGLEGFWDFDIKYTFRGMLAQTGSDGITLFDALDKQLGLKLEAQKAPSPVIMVDSVNENPAANPPEVATSLPPGPPPEFEVAEIKPSMPGVRQSVNFRNGRVDVHAFPLKRLVMLAWDSNSDDLISAPKWLESARFDIVAKAATTQPGEQVDFDAMRLMLRALLIDRFRMMTHTEQRPVNTYALLAMKPKLHKADPSSRTRCKEGPQDGAKDARDANPILSRLFTCQNTTMAQFAGQLQRLAGGYIRTPVLDETGLEGAWDFSVSFSPAGQLQNGERRRGDAGQQNDNLAPSDPSGAVSLFDAINKQLGLKLEMQKRPNPVLVIDHIEEKPTDN